MKEPPLVVANAAVLRLAWIFTDEVGFNVFGVRIVSATAIDQPLAETLGTAIKSAFTTNLGLVTPASTRLERVGIRDIRAAGRPEFRDTGAPVAGTEAAVDALPPGTAICITLRTAQTGRSFRGRCYLGGFSESSNGANGTMLGGISVSATNFVVAIRNALTASGLALAILSRPSFRQVNTETTFDAAGAVLETHTQTHNARPGGITDVTAVENRNQLWESQRRRNNGRGTTAIAGLSPVTSHHF